MDLMVEEMEVSGFSTFLQLKQKMVVDYMTKAEYIAAFEAAKEVVWIRKFVFELGVVPSTSTPMDLHCDNSGAIAHAKEPSVGGEINQPEDND